MAFERFSDKLEKRINDFPKLPSIHFRVPSSPQSCYREWKQLFHLRLEHFQFQTFVSANKEMIFQNIWSSYDRVNQPNQIERQSLEAQIHQIDIAVQSLLLTSLPMQILQDNGSFIKICQTRPNTDGASYTIFKTVAALLSHKVEVEKVELMAQLSKLKTSESMSAYIGVKQNARAILEERFESKYDDAFQRTYLLAGIREDSECKTLYEHLLQQQNQSLADTITAMEVYAREKLVKVSSSPAVSSSSALHISEQPQPRRQMFKSMTGKQAFKERSNKTKVTQINTQITQTPCRNFAIKGECTFGNDCNFKHITGNILRQTPCPYSSNCRNFSNGKCLYKISSHATPSSSKEKTTALLASKEDDSWGLHNTAYPAPHF